MSSTEPDDEDFSNAPFLDENERAESDWLRERDENPDAPAPSLAAARDYADLEDRLARLPSVRADDTWQDEVLKALPRVLPPSRKRRLSAWWWSVGGGTILAAAAMALLLTRQHPRGAELDVLIQHADLARGDDVAVGDHLIVRSRAHGDVDLRVYRADGSLVAKCPAGPSCATAPGAIPQVIEHTFAAPGKYHVILSVGLGYIGPVPMEDYLRAAQAAQARVVVLRPIDVH